MALAAAVAVCAPMLMGADHLDGPAASADPAADITDVFAWMSSDAKTVYMIMNVVPLATTSSKFSTAVQYVFHTTSRQTFGASQVSSTNIICTFDSNQRISCWAGDEYINGDASGTSGLSSGDGKLKVYAGVRDDPFFFNLDGFKATAHIVDVAKANLTFDTAGCPQLDGPTSSLLVNQLRHAPDGGTPQDFFKGLNVASIVVAVDKSLVTQGGTILGVWASTNKP